MSQDKDISQGDYEVGYGKPPKQHQFGKGQSGNVNGRPKKREVGQANVSEMLSRPILARTKRGMTSIPPNEAAMLTLVSRALKDDHLGSVLTLLEIFEKDGELAMPDNVIGGGVVTAPPGMSPEEWIQSFTSPGQGDDCTSENDGLTQ